MARFKPKRTCEEMLSIDIRFLKRHRVTGPGTIAQIDLDRSGHPIGTINLKTSINSITINGNLDSRPINQTFQLTYSKTNFNAQRPWFQCPDCNSRVAILYLDNHFACRKCLDLAYTSQRETKSQRYWRKATKISYKLDGSYLLQEWIPERPKYMKQARFEDLEHEYYYWRDCSILALVSD